MPVKTDRQGLFFIISYTQAFCRYILKGRTHCNRIVVIDQQSVAVSSEPISHFQKLPSSHDSTRYPMFKKYQAGFQASVTSKLSLRAIRLDKLESEANII